MRDAAYPRHAAEFDALQFMRDEYWRLARERRLARASRDSSREALMSMAPTQGYGWPERPRLARPDYDPRIDYPERYSDGKPV